MATSITEAEYEAAVAFAEQLRLFITEGTEGAKVLPAILLPAGAYPGDSEHIANQMMQRFALAVLKSMRALEAPPNVGTAALGELMRFAAADHTHGGGGGGGGSGPGAWAALDYAAAANVWEPFPGAGYSGFTKPAARARIEYEPDASKKVRIEGALRKVGLVGWSAGDVLCRLPDAAMYPTNAGERIFACGCWAGRVNVHVTGTDFSAGSYSGAGWLRIYDSGGSPHIAISLDGITFVP